MERLESRVPPVKLERTVRTLHQGMKRIGIEAMAVRDAKGDAVGVFQRFNLEHNQAGRPTIIPKILSLLVRARAERFARERDCPVKFRVYFAGRDESGREWERQSRFTIDPDKLDDVDENDEEEEEEAAEDEEDNAATDDEEDSDDGDGEADDEDEFEEGDEDEDEVQAPRVVARSPAPATARPRSDADEYIDHSRQGALVPAERIHPVVNEAREMGLQPSFEHGVPMQNNPEFLLQVISQAHDMAARVFAGSAKEQRRMVRTMRRECTAILRDTRRNTNMVIADAVKQRELANRHAEALGQQLIDTTELNAAHYTNLQEIAKQGWAAFRHSMEIEKGQYERSLEYERAIYGQKIGHANELAEQRVGPSAWPGLVKRAAPTVLGGLAFLAGRKGDKELAELLANLATLVAPGRDDYDDEEEGYDEDEDEQDGEPEPPRRRSRRAPAAEPQPEPEAAAPEPQAEAQRPAPTRDAARELLDSLDAEQRLKVSQAMPKLAWEAFEAAAMARTESTAAAAVTRLDAMMRANVPAGFAVLGLLKTEQQQKLNELIANRAKRRVPPRPRAAAASA